LSFLTTTNSTLPISTYTHVACRVTIGNDSKLSLTCFVVHVYYVYKHLFEIDTRLLESALKFYLGRPRQGNFKATRVKIACGISSVRDGSKLAIDVYFHSMALTVAKIDLAQSPDFCSSVDPKICDGVSAACDFVGI